MYAYLSANLIYRITLTVLNSLQSEGINISEGVLADKAISFSQKYVIDFYYIANECPSFDIIGSNFECINTGAACCTQLFGIIRLVDLDDNVFYTLGCQCGA